MTGSRTDQELVAAAAGGDTNSFAALVERYQKLACAVAYSATGDVSASEDIAQEAFVTAWTQLSKLDEPGKFRPWLAGIVRNTSRSWRRHQGRHAPTADASEGTLSELAAEGPSPLARAVARQDLSMAKRALETLPSKYREALVLYHALGESYAEVANALQISEATARQRLSRARKKLEGEVGAIRTAAGSCGRRAGAAAAVLLLIKSNSALAAAATSKAKLAAGLSSKGILALGAAGIAAALVVIASLVAMLTAKPAPSDARQEPKPETAPSDQSSANIVSAPPASKDRRSIVSAPQHDAGPSEDVDQVHGEVLMGRGKVKDRTGTPSHDGAQPAAASHNRPAKKDPRGKVKHGPAVVQPNGPKPLLKPSLQRSEVESELYGSD